MKMTAAEYWQAMTDEARKVQRRHLDRHDGDVYHAMQHLVVRYGCPDTRPMTQPIDASPLDLAFEKDMVGRQYGPEETADAKAWFAAGYNAVKVVDDELLPAYLASLNRLVAACEREFTDADTDMMEDASEPVALPSSEITFGDIWLARDAIDNLLKAAFPVVAPQTVTMGDYGPNDVDYNGCHQSAIRALRYIAKYGRPAEGGEQFPNIDCCEQAADELERSFAVIVAFAKSAKIAPQENV